MIAQKPCSRASRELGVTEHEARRLLAQARSRRMSSAISRIDGVSSLQAPRVQSRTRRSQPSRPCGGASRRPTQTTAAFDHAQQVMREVAERQQAEQTAAAHAAQLESEDEQLRAERARQAAYDAGPFPIL
jgi:hypothetical protein